MQTPARGKPLGVLTYWVVAMLALTAVIDILGVVSLLIERSLVLDSLDGRPVSIDEAIASDQRVEAIGVWTLIALLVTGVLWCIWQHRLRPPRPAVHTRMGRGLVVHPVREPLEAFGRRVGALESQRTHR